MRAVKISVIVNFHNMRREATRTLYTLSNRYQQHDVYASWDITAIDNNSSVPIDLDAVESMGLNLNYLRYFDGDVSPVAAINRAVQMTSGDYVMIIIDGARMLSPGIFMGVSHAVRAFENPFIYTMGMHLGPKLQNYSMMEGYNQAVEDDLLASIDWKLDGYDLFKISSLAASARLGFLSNFNESNCFVVKRSEWISIGGYDERYVSMGGGLANLEFFQRVMEDPQIDPILLLGEATFHQFHGGTATNVPIESHPWKKFSAEHNAIAGGPLREIGRSPYLLGRVSESARHLLVAGKG